MLKFSYAECHNELIIVMPNGIMLSVAMLSPR
jgi:hypothetical protein